MFGPHDLGGESILRERPGRPNDAARRLFEHNWLQLPDEQHDTALFAEDLMLGAGRVERDVARLDQALGVSLTAADDDHPLPTRVAMARCLGARLIAQNRGRRPAVGIAMQPRRFDSLAKRLETQRRRIRQQIADDQVIASRMATTGAVQPTAPPWATIISGAACLNLAK